MMFSKIIKPVCSFSLLLVWVLGISAEAADTEVFKGKIGRSVETSVASWPEPVKAPEGAPNVLIWLIDDAGFGHTSAFGGLIDTPTFVSKRSAL